MFAYHVSDCSAFVQRKRVRSDNDGGAILRHDECGVADHTPEDIRRSRCDQEVYLRVDVASSQSESEWAVREVRDGCAITGIRTTQQIPAMPIVFMLGNHSSGKSTFINYITGQ